MNTLEAISKRRSIRKFLDKEIPRETVEKILDAAILAPSAKNLQPWKFIVVTNANKAEMLRAMRSGIDNAREQMKNNPNIDNWLAGARYTANVMEQAPITVFVLNTINSHPWVERDEGAMLSESSNTQSIGAAIQNMLLAATSLGIGSLWICDVFFAYREICGWLGEEHQLVAAVSLGYADENPGARPRKATGEVVQWR